MKYLLRDKFSRVKEKLLARVKRQAKTAPQFSRLEQFLHNRVNIRIISDLPDDKWEGCESMKYGVITSYDRCIACHSDLVLVIVALSLTAEVVSKAVNDVLGYLIRRPPPIVD